MRFRLRTWLTRWGVLALLLVQLAGLLGIYGSASHLLWGQAEQRQLRTIDTFWLNRPDIFGGKHQPKLESLRATLLAKHSPKELELIAQAARLQFRMGADYQRSFLLWGPMFAEVAGQLADCQSIQLFGPRGELVYRSVAEPAPYSFSSQEIQQCLELGLPVQRRVRRGFSEAYVALLYPLRAGDSGRVLGVLQAERDVHEIRDHLNALAVILLLCNALAFGAGALLLYWLADKVCTPLEQLAENTRRLGQGQFSERTQGTHFPHEIWSLAQAFDQAAARLQTSFESQSRFVADASHELKTPLTILGGMAEILEIGSRQDDPERQKAVHMIGQQVERMSRLVSDLLLLSKPSEEADLEPVELSGLLEDLVDGASMWGGRSHEFALECSPEARVSGPETRVERIFRNLLDNAVQHGGRRISISVRVHNERVEARIGDDGPGIAAEDLPYICDRFYRPDRSRQRGTGGTGLGLAIVKSLVESMNGRLVIESQPGRGTTITLDLPCSENVQGRRLLYPGEKTAEAQCKSS